MKKYKLLHKTSLLLICFFALTQFSGCLRSNYTCVVPAEIEKFVNENIDTSKNATVSIGDSMYEISYTLSEKDNSGVVFDNYDVIEDESKKDDPLYITPQIRKNSENGEIVGFSQITPYPIINNIDKLTDDEIRAKVETMLSDLADFSEYNVFEINKPSSTSGVSYWSLSWRIKRELLCNISVTVTINRDGKINRFQKNDSCPDDLKAAFVSESERNAFLEKAICKKLGISSIGNFSYKILYEFLGYYNGKNAIYYGVAVYDGAGFSAGVFPFVISQ